MTRTPDAGSLDGLLAHAGEVPERGARVAAALERIAATEPAPPGRGVPRRAVVIGVTVAGVAGLLTAGVTLSTAWLTSPPFQELPEGWSRTTEWAQVDWESPDGEFETCRIYLELERADRDVMASLDDALRERDWDDFGQELYDSLPGDPVATSVESEVLDLAFPIVYELAHDAIPGLGGFGAAGDGPALGAGAATCRTDL
jgi:hypothetical protein